MRLHFLGNEGAEPRGERAVAVVEAAHAVGLLGARARLRHVQLVDGQQARANFLAKLTKKLVATPDLDSLFL